MKDQQTNNMDSQDVMNNASRGQEVEQQDGNNVPSPDNNECVGTQQQPLSTGQFQKLLAANTAKLNKLRLDYAQRLADLQDEYGARLDGFLIQEHLANKKLHDARKVFEEAKEKYELDLHDLRKNRNEIGRKHNVLKAEAKNYWTTENEKIQSERHNIFERFRDSGGVLPKEAEGLLHPGWTRDKKGGMSDEEK